MPKPFTTNYRKVKLPRQQHEFEEFGKAKKGLLICKNCNIYYYQKSWHHDADSFITKRENKDLPVNFTLCPACKMIVDKEYEGEVKITNVPDGLRGELRGLIEGFCKRAWERDPLDRLAGLKEKGGEMLVLTTENQLANKLAKKIKSTFNGVKTKTVFSKDPSDFVRVLVEFLKK